MRSPIVNNRYQNDEEEDILSSCSPFLASGQAEQPNRAESPEDRLRMNLRSRERQGPS